MEFRIFFEISRTLFLLRFAVVYVLLQKTFQILFAKEREEVDGKRT